MALNGMEAAAGVEPANSGFADRRLSHLAMPPHIARQSRRVHSLSSDERSGPGNAGPASGGKFMEREKGFAPSTICMASRCSTVALLPHQTESETLAADLCCRPPPLSRRSPPVSAADPRRSSGAGNGIRTRDPQLGKLMLYQLSYSRSLRPFLLTPSGLPAARLIRSWWAMQDLNLRLLACEASALPLS